MEESKSMDHVVEEEEKGTDRISKLPDAVLSSIISLLPTYEAIATSILSRRWKPLYLSLSRLHFDPKQMIYFGYFDGDIDERLEPQLLSTIPIIDKIIYSQINTAKLISCKIFHFLKDLESGKLQEWIQFLIDEKSIEEISLICEKYKFTWELSALWENGLLPVGIFSGKTLSVLELKDYQLFDACAFQGCSNLKTLNLNSVDLSGDTLVRILSNCPRLESLGLYDCFGLDYIRIQHTNLKFLEIERLYAKNLQFELFAEELTTLALANISFGSDMMNIRCPKVNVLRFHCGTFNILERCFMGTAHFHPLLYDSTIRLLSAMLDLNNMLDAVLLSTIFRMCTRLHRLEITDVAVRDPVQYEEDFEMKFWVRRDLFDYISRHLSVVVIRYFRGKEREVKLVTLLIKNAVNLEKLEIQCNDKCSRQEAVATMDLHYVPKASINLSIILKPGLNYMEQVGLHFEDWILTLK